MEPIKEDYVSFETAKLLKEKGFDEGCRAHYGNAGSFSYEKYEVEASGCEIHNAILAPTLQMVMKWLRKVHKIGVFPSTYSFGVFPSTYSFMVGENGSAKHVYGTAIINLETYELMTPDMMPMPTYEEAAEVAIKYCLENLI